MSPGIKGPWVDPAAGINQQWRFESVSWAFFIPYLKIRDLWMVNDLTVSSWRGAYRGHVTFSDREDTRREIWTHEDTGVG